MLCPNCQSENVIPNVEIFGSRLDLSSTIAVRVQKDPTAMVFTGAVYSDLRARICGNCGHTTLHTVDYKDLWQAHQKAQGKTS